MDEKKETCHCKRCKRDLPKADFFESRKHWAQCNICRAKKLASRKIWLEGNGKQWTEAYKVTYAAKQNENCRKYRERHPEKRKEHYENNKEACLASGKIYRQNNKEKERARQDRWIKENKDRCKCTQCDYTTCDKSTMANHIEAKHTDKLHCSKGEAAIIKVLDDMEIEYKHDRSYELKDIHSLKWDFIIQTDSRPIFIEYDGKQHFEPVRFGGRSQEKAEIAFQKQTAHDKLKDDYCSQNNYPLLRIPYTQFGNVKQLVAEFVCEHTDWGYE